MSPVCGSRFKPCCTWIAKLFMPRRISVCPTASQTRTPEGTGIIAATAPLRRLPPGSAGIEPGIRAVILPAKLQLDRRLAMTLGSYRAPYRFAFRRGDQQRRKPGNRRTHLLTPAINPPRRDVDTASDLGNDSSRREALRNNRPLLIVAPPPSTFDPGDCLNSRHRLARTLRLF
jgi:hypothetical protein